MIRKASVLAGMFALLSTLFASAYAQQATGQITGVVTDPGGALIVGARITVTSQATKVVRQTTTNNEGFFQVLSLPIGEYQVTAEHPGFRKYVAESNALQINQTLRLLGGERPGKHADVAVLLKLLWEGWNEVFRGVLGQSERTLVSELRDVRNRWAHQQPISGDDAYRALDSAARLLTAVSAPQADEVEKMKMELLRVRFDEQVRSEKRKGASTPIESAAAAGLKPWREVITPHKDVASGRYQQAEFAADLWQVQIGEGSPEYRDPVEFFRRTFLTESLKRLLVGAVQRMSGKGGDPVISSPPLGVTAAIICSAWGCSATKNVTAVSGQMMCVIFCAPGPALRSR